MTTAPGKQRGPKPSIHPTAQPRSGRAPSSLRSAAAGYRQRSAIMRAAAMLSLLFASTRAIAQSYGLEEWTDKYGQHIAPARIQEFMQRSLRRDYLDCMKYCEATSSEASQYFGATEIALSARGMRCYLVFPSKYCASFFGAHAIAYWIVAEPRPDQFKILYEGRSDGITIRKDINKGFYNFESAYNNTFIVLEFNGTKYRKVAGGEYPNE